MGRSATVLADGATTRCRLAQRDRGASIVSEMGTPDLQDRPAVDPTGGDPPPGRGRLDRRMLLPLIAIVAIVGGFAILLANTGHRSQPLPGGARSAKSASFSGNELTPPKPAPGVALRNYLGGPRG